MNPRSPLLLLLVVALLGAVIWFWEVRGRPLREEAEAAAKLIYPDVASEDIRRIELTTSDGHNAVLEFDEGWKLTQPLAFPADEGAAAAMADSLAQLASEAVIEDPQDPAVYGLGEGASVVRFQDDTGQTRELWIGAKTPVGQDQYVTTGAGQPVYTVRSHHVSGFERRLDELRDRRVARFQRSQVTGIQAAWPGGGVTLEKRDGGWRVVQPLSSDADPRTVEDLLSTVSFLRADGFDDAPGDADEASLEIPAYELTLRLEPDGAEPQEVHIVIGGTLPGGERLVRGAETSLYRIRSNQLKDFPRKLASYRFRTLAQFVPTDARRVEMVFAGPEGEGPVTITARHGDDGWTTSPEPMASGKVARLVAELAGLRADDILADTLGPDERAAVGLNPPAAILRVFGGPEDSEKRLAEVRLGHVDSERGIPALGDRSEVVYLLSYDEAEFVPVSLEAFRNRFLSKAEDEEAEPPEPELPELD